MEQFEFQKSKLFVWQVKNLETGKRRYREFEKILEMKQRKRDVERKRDEAY